jgi:hypothetical protein
MKKLATLITVASLSIAAPAFACPGHDDAAAAPKTAEKAKEAPKKDAPKAETPKPTETAKAKVAPKKEEPKKPEKVSAK